MCKISLKEYFKRSVSSDKFYEGIDKLIDLPDNLFLSQKSTGQADLWGVNSNQVRLQLVEAINKLKILDPACGSGAFPIGMLQLLLKTCDRLSLIYDNKLEKMRLVSGTEATDTYNTKLFIIRNCLYGVDIEPMAAEISRLRAWLSLIIDDNTDIEPLPNLDFNFVCANTLVKLPSKEEDDLPLFTDNSYEERFQKLRDQYFNAHNKKEKNTLRDEFYKLYNEKNTDDDVTKSNRFKMLTTWDPFRSTEPAKFFDSKTMFNVENFPIVIGNPPYVRLQDIKEYSKELYAKLNFKTYDAYGDLYCLFIEKSVELLQINGILSFITSNKWLKSGYGRSLRGFLAKFNPILLLDFANIKVFESATVDSCILQLSKEVNLNKTISCKLDSTNTNKLENIKELVNKYSVLCCFNTTDSWLVLSSIEKSIIEKIQKKGTPLSNWDIQINYGVKTGCNKAFIINKEERKRILSNCLSDDERQRTDKIIRPVLRGKDISRYSYNWKEIFLINFHNGLPRKKIQRVRIEEYPTLKKWFDVYLPELKKRADQGDSPYNLRSCAYLDEFNKQKIVYKEISQELSFSLASEDMIILNTAYMITSKKRDELKWLLMFLNSKIINWYYHKVSTQLGSATRMLYMNVVRIPIIRFEDNIALFDEMNGYINDKNSDAIDDMIFELYGLSKGEIKYVLNSTSIT